MHLDVNKRFDVWYERLTLPRAVATVISVAFILVLVSGALVRIVEPDVFTSIGLAYWWAVETVTTVGYGDIVPETPAGRLVGTALMLTGLGLIPTLTSVTVAILVGKRTQRPAASSSTSRAGTTPPRSSGSRPTSPRSAPLRAVAPRGAG